jgi:DNA-binding CsgD family transcriptional regulator
LSEDFGRSERVTAGPPDQDVERIAAHALSGSPFAALVLARSTGLIVAASPAATQLLTSDGAPVVGATLEHFTIDSPAPGPDPIGDAQRGGLEVRRVLRGADGGDLEVRMWVRSWGGHNNSAYVVVIIVPADATKIAGQPDDAQWPAVTGTIGPDLMLDAVSSDATPLFGWSITDLIGRPIIDLLARSDVASCLTALNEAAAGDCAITLQVDVLTSREPNGQDPTVLTCDMVVLPLRPGPSYSFVLLPVPAEPAGARVATDLSTVLSRLGRSAEIAQLVRVRTTGLTEADLPGLGYLTTRELEVLTRLLDGDRVPAIAAELFLSQGTVRNYLTSIFGKVGVSSQQQLLTLFRAARAARD